jgi:hypothetical protein
MFTFLLIVHGLIAVALIGGITHQTVAACWPARRKEGFFTSFRAVAGTRYTNANIALYLAAACAVARLSGLPLSVRPI